ncbi:tRNA1(Val) (adenine(37)-N6)-methyltransferase [Sulfurimonas paralvinellae]|uniref:Methyltransferase n=1 Tax=Sulfurimonas paralvinellae TaxID=317658 RepID=A0A7M1B6I2_9BACT|nr:methyltransferase [Sulfurimonas paralvinellae]QOP45324.1 methyltransferase [Sulfurimonas paralvinellae]
MILYQPESGYCYNSDSIFLYDFINRFHPKGSVLDVGAGCGVVGLLVARDNEKVELEAVEKQNVLAEYAKKNAVENEIGYKLYEDDFLALRESNQKYDYIISNPPFYPDGVQKSKDTMLTHARYNSSLPMDDFFKKVSQLLKPHSHFIFCYDATQFGIVCAALERVKMRVVDVRFVHPKIDRTASLVLIHARNGSKSMLKVHPPLIHFDGDKLTQEVEDIYKNAKTESVKCQL